MKFRKLKKNVLTIFTLVKNRVPSIPKTLWGLSAIFGIFAAGVIFALLNGINDFERAKVLEEQNKQLIKLAEGYEKLVDLYHLQGKNISVIFDPDILYNHPEEIDEAMASIDQFKGEMQRQYGRILEMRDQAGLSDPSAQSN